MRELNSIELNLINGAGDDAADLVKDGADKVADKTAVAAAGSFSCVTNNPWRTGFVVLATAVAAAGAYYAYTNYYCTRKSS